MNNILFSSIRPNWETPKDLFDKLNKKFNFDIDACADDQNKLCNEYYTQENSILNKDFDNKVIFMNPPYGRGVYKFVELCRRQQVTNTIVLLIPARTDTKYFHDFIYHNKHAKIEFLKGRLKFGNCNKPAPFPSMIVTFKNLELYNEKYLYNSLVNEVHDL